MIDEKLKKIFKIMVDYGYNELCIDDVNSCIKAVKWLIHESEKMKGKHDYKRLEYI